jgi:inhibitor of cysteine peptidase
MPGDILTLGTGDGGRTVSVRPGDRIVLRLPENPTTGYRWSGAVPEGLQLARDGNAPASAAPGAGGERVFEYIATMPGEYALDLVLSRAWETPAAADPRFRITVRVE